MYEEQPPVKPHQMILQNRHALQLTGVLDVISYDADEIVLETTAGLLMIKGEELHMHHLLLDKGETGIEGNVDSMMYAQDQRGTKQATHLLGRLFK